jgi:phytoene dehydrogenase-like protein
MSAVEGRHDAVVIGGGVGGLAAAARLTMAGRKPLLIEAEDKVGGRFSTIEVDGYKVPTGAIAVETSGPFWELFGELGIDPELRVPDPPVMVHVRGKDLKPGAAVWQHMIKRVTKSAGKVAENIAKARDGEEPGDEITLEEWTKRYTKSKTLLSMFQGLSAAIFTVNADELPAGVFFRLLRETGGYKSYGFAPQGNIVIAAKIAAEIERRGGTVVTGWSAESIEFDGDRAVAVHATGADGTERIEADAVISNLGPRNTTKLVAGSEVAEAFAVRSAPIQTTALLALAFSTQEEVVKHPGIWNFTDTERLCNLANLTATCPDLAPPGRKLYEAYSAPRPSIGGEFDEAAERELLEADLRKQIPGFADAEVVLFKAMRGDKAPAQQAVPGRDADVHTPSPNLVEVGDGVKPYGWIGTTACAQTARTAVDALLAEAPLDAAATR